jgi:3-oxoadipate CoA-transferase beta subunit
MTMSRIEIATMVAMDIPDGAYVNLGIGMPTDVARVIDPGKEVVLHSENGILGVGAPPRPGDEDPDLVDAGKAAITLVRGGSFVSHADSFAMIRGGHLDIAVLGAFQVSAKGDLANWDNGGGKIPAIGGAMDLAVGAKEVWVMISLSDGRVKLVDECSYPLTAAGIVTRIYSDLGLLVPTGSGFRVAERAPDVTLADIREVTAVQLVE